MLASLRRTFLQPDRPDLRPPAAWLWDPWEYATTGPGTLHRANPDHPGHTMCGHPYLGLLGTPAWTGAPHCPGCVAAPEPAQPAEFWRLEFARLRRIGGRLTDVVAVQHTTATAPTVREQLPHILGLYRDVTRVAGDLGCSVEYGPHYDPRTDTSWARVTEPAPLTLF